MSVRNNNNQLLNPQAMAAMDKFKLEAAEELNIRDEYKSGYWGNLTSRECGSVGGQMVKKMISEYENQLANNNTTNFTNQNNADYETGQEISPQTQQNVQATTNAQTQESQQENYNLGAKAGSYEPQQ